MNNKKLCELLPIVLTFVLGLIIFLVTLDTIHAQDVRIVKIYGGSSLSTGDIYLDPQTLWISKGDIVIWNNLARTPRVQIVFKEGKECQKVTSAPTGFKFDQAQECYLTDSIIFGGTASLRFNEQGTYEYLVRDAVETISIKAKGKVIAK